MTKLNFNTKIIEEIRAILPKDESVANALMEVLSLGKESIYRRLRGEVLFSLEETAKLAERYHFSIDRILDRNGQSRDFFDLDVICQQTRVEDYADRLGAFIRFFKEMHDCPTAKVRYALNTLPYILYLNFPNLSRFKYFKCLYQAGMMAPNFTYQDMEVPQQILDLQKNFIAESQFNSEITMILDRNVFSSMCYDVEYFYKLRLIDKEGLEAIKQEMLQLLDGIEKVAATGTYRNSSRVALYLSNLDLEASYTHMEYNDKQYAHLRLFGLSGVDSHCPCIGNRQREWIDSLKRYSTLISISGQVQRYDYLNQQRDIIAAMG